MASFHAPIFRKLYESVVSDQITKVTVQSHVPAEQGDTKYRISVQRRKSVHLIDRTFQEVTVMHQSVQKLALENPGRPILLSGPPVPSRKRLHDTDNIQEVHIVQINNYFDGLFMGILASNAAEFQPVLRRFFAPRSEHEIRTIKAYKEIGVRRDANCEKSMMDSVRPRLLEGIPEGL